MKYESLYIMGNEDVFYVIVAVVVAVIIIAIFYFPLRGRSNCCAGTSETIANASEIVARFIDNRKNKENIFAFRKAIGDDKFSPYHFAQLATLYKEGKLTTESAERVITAV